MLLTKTPFHLKTNGNISWQLCATAISNTKITGK